MFKKIVFVSFILIILINLAIKSHAQVLKDSVKALPSVGLPQYALKFSFLSLADPSYQSVQFAFEYQLKDNLYLQHEVGYIYGLTGLSWYQEDFECTGGVRFRSELRNYFNLHRTDMKFKYYFAPEILFILVSAQNLDFKGVNCADGGCDYFQLQRTRDKKYVTGAHFKIGGQSFFNWFGFEYYAGLGVRYKWYDSRAQPNGILDFASSENEILPSVVLGVKIGWGF